MRSEGGPRGRSSIPFTDLTQRGRVGGSQDLFKHLRSMISKFETFFSILYGIIFLGGGISISFLIFLFLLRAV
jgi:hypothetical protein